MDEDDRSWISPSLYGVRSERTGGGSVLVDTPDSTGPLTLIVGTPGTSPEDWAAVQALLERHGIGSVVFTPPGSAWVAPLREFIDHGLEAGRRLTRPTAVLAFATALDSLLAATPVGHGVRASRLVVVGPASPPAVWWRTLFARIRPGTLAEDARLGTWTGPALVVHAQDDTPARLRAAQHLAAATGRAVGVLPGGGMEQAPQHPRDYDWREIIDFVIGQKQARDAIVGDDSVTVVVDTLDPSPPSVPASQPTVGSP